MIKKALIFILLSLCLSGCGNPYTPQKIDLSYVPQPRVSILPDGNNVVLDVQINDKRREKSRKIASHWSDRGQEIWEIHTSVDVTKIITQAIENELNLCGFSIGNQGSFLIVIDLNKFWSEQSVKYDSWKGHYITTLDFEISVKNRNGDIIFKRVIFVEGAEPCNYAWWTRDENARIASNKALVNGMKVLFSDQNFLAALIEASKKTI